MKLSSYFLHTFKEIPKEASIISHQLMLRSGMIHQTLSGIYSWTPLGQRVLKNVENIVEEEQNLANAQRIIMPTIQPATLWRESGRYDDYGKEMLRILDRHDRELLYGPTHEEVVVDLFKFFVRSYKELPLTLYQIHWKFRDEIRPRFGVMRGREFLMKDGYSFHRTHEDVLTTYKMQFQAYMRTFFRMGLRAIPVRAKPGPIGGSLSHEFQIMAKTGESQIYYDKKLESITADEIDFDSIQNCYAAADEEHDSASCPLMEDDLKTARGIEVGHIFILGQKYTIPLKVSIPDETGASFIPYMGTYGIGVSRLVVAIIEVHHDEKGIVWPLSVAPFHVALLNLKHSNPLVQEKCNTIYEKLMRAGIEVLYDDRDERAGVKFNDMDLIGLPYQILVSEKSLSSDELEIKNRKTNEAVFVTLDNFILQLQEALKKPF